MAPPWLAGMHGQKGQEEEEEVAGARTLSLALGMMVMLAGQSVREVGEQASSRYDEANQGSWICAGNEWDVLERLVLFLMKCGGQHLTKWILNICYVW